MQHNTERIKRYVRSAASSPDRVGSINRNKEIDILQVNSENRKFLVKALLQKSHMHAKKILLV